MFSLRLLLVVILVSFGVCSLGQTLNERICNENSLTVQSIARPFGTDFVYLIASNLVFKLIIKSADHSVIESAQKLEDWDPTIQPNIDLIYTTKTNPKHISLINCALRKEWVIRYEDNHYNGSLGAVDCGNLVEYVLDPETGVLYWLFNSLITKEMVIETLRPDRTWFVMSLRDKPRMIKALGYGDSEIRLTDKFNLMKGQLISAAFIHDRHWYLFAGRYYCIIKMSTFDECIPQLISEWISNCSPGWKELQSGVPKSKDISLYVIIVVAVICMAVLVVALMLMLTCRTNRKKGYYMTTE